MEIEKLNIDVNGVFDFTSKFETGIISLNLFGYLTHVELEGNVSYNLAGKISQVGPIKINYNMAGKISSIGGVSINYNMAGKVSSIGNKSINYNIAGKISSFGNIEISYNLAGKISSIGNKSITYNTTGKISSGIRNTIGDIVFVVDAFKIDK